MYSIRYNEKLKKIDKLLKNVKTTPVLTFLDLI